MGLLNDIMDERPRKSRHCTVHLLLASMDTKDQSDLETALEDLTIQSTIIQRVLERKGYKIASTALARHRRGDCACE